MKRQGFFVVIALKEPGPKWEPVSEPIPWEQVIKAIQAQWRFGRLARAVAQ